MRIWAVILGQLCFVHLTATMSIDQIMTLPTGTNYNRLSSIDSVTSATLVTTNHILSIS
jgi:hypothetical protein